MTDEYLVNKNLNRIKKSDYNIILFGEVGCGKTTIINKLCGTDFLTEKGGYCCTKVAQSAYIPDGSIIIDFPGLNAAESAFNNLKVQKSILSIIPVRIICFIIRYDRYDLIIKKAFEMLKIFLEHKNNICIIITFSETLNLTKKAEIEQIFTTKFKIPRQHIIFSSNYVDKKELLSNINKVKNSVQNISSIKFNERNLIDTIGKEGISLEVYEFREKYRKEYYYAIELFKKEFTKTNDYSLKFSLYYSFRDYRDNLVNKFSDEVKKIVTDIDSAVVEIITFNNELYEPFEKITEKFESEMKVESVNYNNNDRYKKCPNCGRIWLKENNCSIMKCGNRTVDNNIEVYGITPEEKEKNKGRIFVHKIVPVGCGSSLNWETLEDVTDMVNNVLKKTFADKTYDNKMKEQLKDLNVEI